MRAYPYYSMTTGDMNRHSFLWRVYRGECRARMGRFRETVSTIHTRSSVVKINVLSMQRMLVLSRYWLTNTEAQAAFASHELGLALRKQIAQAYEDLSNLQKRRYDARALLDAIRKILESLDDIHDRFARALHAHLTGLLLAARNPDESRWYADTQALLFPSGLSIVNSSYADEAGMAEAVKKQLTPEIMNKLAMSRVGEHTLADLVNGWLDSGIELGERVIERERLQASITGDGDEVELVSTHQVRGRWKRTTHAMLAAIDLMDLSEPMRRALVEPLERMIAQALRERAGQPIPPDDDIDDDHVDDDTPDTDPELALASDMDMDMDMDAMAEAEESATA